MSMFVFDRLRTITSREVSWSQSSSRRRQLQEGRRSFDNCSRRQDEALYLSGRAIPSFFKTLANNPSLITLS